MKRFLPMLLFVFWVTGAHAQDANAPESFQIGLSTNRVAISSDFSGADLTIFGALDNADQALARQGRYDIVVVLEGPARPITVRKKTRVLGVWVNTQSQSFASVPISYAVATTRPMQDITQPVMYQRLALGSENIFMRAVEDEEQRNPERVAEFTAALRQQKRATGLYNERIGGVQFLSPSLFRATLTLAPNVPVGTHRARAFLFRNGVFVKETSAQLTIVKAGLEERIYRTAQDNGLVFGLLAVLLAVVTGWLGRLIFKRD
ncbi:TIGR02186 family protein [Aliihoeflea sp. PC F10.4]